MIKKLLLSTVLFSALVVKAPQSAELVSIDTIDEFFTKKIYPACANTDHILSRVKEEERLDYKAKIYKVAQVFPRVEEDFANLMGTIVGIPHRSLDQVINPVVYYFQSHHINPQKLPSTIRQLSTLAKDGEKNLYYTKYVQVWEQVNSGTIFSEFSDVQNVAKLPPQQLDQIVEKSINIVKTFHPVAARFSVMSDMVTKVGLEHFDLYMEKAKDMAKYIPASSSASDLGEHPIDVLQTLAEVLPQNLTSIVSRSIAEIEKKKVSGEDFFVSDIILEVNKQVEKH